MDLSSHKASRCQNHQQHWGDGMGFSSSISGGFRRQSHNTVRGRFTLVTWSLTDVRESNAHLFVSLCNIVCDGDAGDSILRVGSGIWGTPGCLCLKICAAKKTLSKRVFGIDGRSEETRLHAAIVVDVGSKVACSSSPSKRTEKTFSLCMSAIPEAMHCDTLVVFHGGAFIDCN